ncbi:PREDICTED: N-acetylglucosaminyl-phosphatidylinositol de-N-acetylase-like [Amphimedon queenslandica]|uniref:N-acetylglucosaminylphosphatidylinositol deacetylase n=1 Tax=Amphimedon queenslandica TaxID=400682 RepID=A0A1X7V8N8_AMPQE|nr:PREDICTED: N-acetylglucosaminyl-phosphatidylinositol de-N-acetylase-like [Amphimedon queenslandica]|eukprot:XP_019850264.1 PREDICTED: N-acetylglucosaminyl-phosphatidylinositol de-N-acetylase-like [Amphimedon queenslandica]
MMKCSIFNPLASKPDRIIMLLAIIFFSILCVVISCYFFITSNKNGLSFKSGENTLLVIAHPDDESMFFAPTILHCTSIKGHRLALLCLSIGDYYGKGEERKEELLTACNVLGISSESVVLINDKDLPDNPNGVWSSKIIGRHIVRALSQYDIHRLITFDERGVSGHSNHIDIHKAVKALVANGALSGKEVLYLQTVNVVMKYLSFLSAVLMSNQRCACISSVNRWCLAMTALGKHSSQMNWYRELYKVFSTYLIINIFSLKRH